MKFGTEEWFEKLNEVVSFPSIFAFYYNRKDNLIQVSKVNSKAKVENVRYKDIEPSPLHFHPKQTALIKVKEVTSGQEYHDEVLRLKELWGTEFTSQ